MEIKIYSTPSCPYCKMAKEYLASKGVVYQEFDVATSNEALEEMVNVSGQMGVPVIVVDGDVIVGFDKGRLDSYIAG